MESFFISFGLWLLRQSYFCAPPYMSENCHTNSFLKDNAPRSIAFSSLPGLLVLLISLSLFAGCANRENASPYAEILAQPPFSSLTDSIKHESRNEELYFRRAVLLNSNNLPEPALADFRKAWELKKDERFALGIATLLLEKKPDSAIIFLDKALSILPQSMLLQLTLAHAYEGKGAIEQALAICNRILEQEPSRIDVLKLKADLLDKKGEKNQAVNTLEQAYALTPFDIELNYFLALKYAENKNPRVLSLCDSLVKVDSLETHAEPNYYKGIYYANIGEKQKAVNEFNEAIRKDYYFLDSYIEKAAALYELKQYPNSMKTLELLLTISPKNADGYYWLAKNLEALGDKQQANLNYQKAWGLDNSLIEAREGIERTK